MLWKLKGQAALAYKRFVFFRIVAWLYTVAWFAGWVALARTWDSMQWYTQAASSLVLLILAPSYRELVGAYKGRSEKQPPDDGR